MVSIRPFSAAHTNLIFCMNYSLTPGADRTIGRAVQLAADNAVGPLHVVKAMLLEEVVAARALDAFGINLLNVGELAADSDSPEIDHHFLDSLLELANSSFRQDAEQSELQSEHLLYGLLATDCPLIRKLAEFELTTESVMEFFADPAKETSPIQVDISLHEKSGIEHVSSPIANPPARHLVTVETQTTSPVNNESVYRIIDAAGNRLREGLRVIDDYVRFILNSPELTQTVKSLRHRVADALRQVGRLDLLKSRNTPADVGTAIHTDSEMTRLSLEDVVVANLKRIQESGRSLEEFGKLIDGQFASQMKQLRYEFYTLESALALTGSVSRCHIRDCRLYVLITEAGCKTDWRTTVQSAIAAGADVVQLREKQLPDDELIERARWGRAATEGTNSVFIMNDRPDIAAAVDADGVHIGQSEGTVAAARAHVGPDRLVGVSTHTIEQARQAVADGADYIGVGPVFPSTTKDFAEFAGLDFVKQVAAEIDIPAFSIGGITADNLDSVIAAGSNRIAVTAAVCSANDIGMATRDLKNRLSTNEHA